MAKEKKLILYVEGTPAPERGTDKSWGVDLFAAEDRSIGWNSVAVVNLGIKMNFQAMITARSSLWKKNVILANGVGIIDEDYRGEVKAPLYNIKPYNVNIFKGDKLCQILIDPQDEVEIRAVSQEEFDNWGIDNPTGRGEGWIGSTWAGKVNDDVKNADWEAAWDGAADEKVLDTESDKADNEPSSDVQAEWAGDSGDKDEGKAEPAEWEWEAKVPEKGEEPKLDSNKPAVSKKGKKK